MYFKLLAGTALVAFASPAFAETVIDNARTTPVSTSTAADNLKIATTGSITLTAGNAVTVDSDDNVVVDGKITVTNSNGSNGIIVQGPRTSDITIGTTGTITVDETYTPTDSDNDGDLDGPYAVGSNRAGIRTTGALTGKIVQNGTITVEGNNSFGVVLGGPVTGSFSHDGKTIVTGDNSTGISTQAISGDVRVGGTITATGLNAVGARLGGDIGGALVVQGAITSTGYRKTTAPADPTKLDADDLLQGGSAVIVEGNVAKGIIFAVAPKDLSTTDNDEDKDGLPDDKEGSSKIISYGAAPAVVLGAADHAITIGATVGTGTGFGVINEGTISGEGVYAGVSATGMQIAGRGGAVTISGGLLNSGGIGASAKNANATALRVGAGANVPELRNSGTILSVTTGTNSVSTAVLLTPGANMPTIKNSGTIKATTATDGIAFAIRDASGSVSLIENSGKILASGATPSTGNNIAIDLSARATGATVRQTAVAAGVAAPSIEGNILFGAGADTLDVQDGNVLAAIAFGSGVDTMKLSGDAVYNGTAFFGGQADVLSLANGSQFVGNADFAAGVGTLTLLDSSLFSGNLLNSQNLAVTVTGGSLDLRGANTIGSLSMGANGILVATLSKTAGAGTAITVGGTASFAEGSKLKLRFTDLASVEGNYSVLTAGTLVGADKLATDSALVPFLYKAALAVTGNTISVDVGRKSATELGLNQAEAAAFNGLFAALLGNTKAAGIFLGIQEEALFEAYVQQTLPDFAGGTFEGISQGVRSFDRHLLDPEGPFDQEGTWRPMFDFVSYSGKKDTGESAAYDLDGLGFRGGMEYVTGVGAFGISGSWLWNKHVTGVENTVTSTSYEGGLHWRGHFGALQTFARGGYGKADFSGTRLFAGGTGTGAVNYEFARDWSGSFVTAAGGASIEGGSRFFFFRPSVIVDYVKLKEDGYVETSATESAGLNLTVDSRTSDELGVNAGLALGADLFGMKSRDDSWLRMEVEGGWRELLSGELGSTTANYGTGTDFVLLPEQRGSGWFARLRGFGGDGFYTVGGELGAEERNGKVGYQIRASLRFGL